MPLPNHKERMEKAKQDTESRVKEYWSDFHERPVLQDRNMARKTASSIFHNEPYFRTAIAGIQGRFGAVFGSKAFRDALVGEVIHDEWVRVGNDPEKVEYERAYNLPGGVPLTKEQEEKIAIAEDMISKLRWCMTAVDEVAAGQLPIDGAQQSANLGALLKRKLPNGVRVIDALRQAASQIERDDPEIYKPKNKNARNKNNADRIDELDEINIDAPRGMQENSEDLLGLNNWIQGEPKAPAHSLHEEIDADLYYLDKTLRLDLNMPQLAPDSVVKPANLKAVKSWDQYLNAMYHSIPADPAKRADHLAKILVGAFEAGRSKVDPMQRVKPFSPSLADRYVKELKEKPVFKTLCRNPAAMMDLMRNNPNRPFKQYNALMNIIRPFGNVDKQESDRILGTLQQMVEFMDPNAGRSSKWKEFTNSIRSYNPNDPNQSGEKKLKEIYDKACAYMKGKKSLRDEESEQNRFDQAMDVLAVLGEATPYAKLAAQAVLDRTNEVRMGHDLDYFPMRMREFGAEKIAEHSNQPKLQLNALDPLPAFHSRLEKVPLNLRRVAKPLNSIAEPIEALFSPGEISEQEAIYGLAAALVLSKERVYYYPDLKHDSTEIKKLYEEKKLKYDGSEEEKRKKYGRVVVDGDSFDIKCANMAANPDVRKLARKYMNPEARKELLRDGALDAVPELKPGRVHWNDHVKKYSFPKMTKQEFDNLIVEEKGNEQAPAKKGEINEMLKVKPINLNAGYRESTPTIDCSRIKLDVLQQKLEAVKRESEIQGPQIT